MSKSKQTRRVDRLITCAAKRFGVNGGPAKARAVADCESSDYAWANNGLGDLGLFQISGWHARLHTWLRHHHDWFPRWSRTWT